MREEKRRKGGRRGERGRRMGVEGGGGRDEGERLEGRGKEE